MTNENINDDFNCAVRALKSGGTVGKDVPASLIIEVLSDDEERVVRE